MNPEANDISTDGPTNVLIEMMLSSEHARILDADLSFILLEPPRFTIQQRASYMRFVREMGLSPDKNLILVSANAKDAKKQYRKIRKLLRNTVPMLVDKKYTTTKTKKKPKRKET